MAQIKCLKSEVQKGLPSVSMKAVDCRISSNDIFPSPSASNRYENIFLQLFFNKNLKNSIIRQNYKFMAKGVPESSRLSQVRLQEIYSIKFRCIIGISLFLRIKLLIIMDSKKSTFESIN